MKFNVFSIFPELFDNFKQTSLIDKAIREKIISIDTLNIRNHGIGKHRKVDDKVYGGDGGMLIRPDVLSESLTSNLSEEIILDQKDFALESPNPIVVMSAKGEKFTQETARKLSTKKSLSIICGRFEGIDQRFIDYYNISEIRIGDYVLFGGEIPAMVIMESVTRLLNGVIGNNGSERLDSFSDEDILEYPQYTLPRIWNDIEVPSVLVSGNHNKIKQWRKSKMINTKNKT